MKLEYAVDRLYEAGWTPSYDVRAQAASNERLPDGRLFPSVRAVQDEFHAAGLVLEIKHNLMFSCYRATWAPLGESLDVEIDPDDRHGTVVAACEREAAVYALAQLRSASLLTA